MRRRLHAVLVLVALLAVLSGGSVALAHTSSLTIDPNATLSGGTVITVTGTVICAAGESFNINVAVFQGRGSNQESAFGSSFTQVCTGAPQLWQVEALSQTGAFRDGKANARATSNASGLDGFTQKSVGSVIYLSS